MKYKTEIVSFAHTFLAVFLPILVVSLDSLNFQMLTREALVAFGVGVLRQTLKSLTTYYFPVVPK